MKPKTKKTILIVAAVAAIAVIVWLVFFRKKSTSAIIAGLNCSKDLKDGLRSMVDLINTTWDDAHKQAISEKAAQNGRTLAQQTVITALYSLYDAEKIDEATYNSVLAQLI